MASVARCMTRQGDELHTVNDCLGTVKRVPLAGLDVWRRDRLCTLEEWLYFLWRLSSDFRRQPEIALSLRNIDLGIRKNALSVLSGQAADVIGVEVRGQDDVDFFRRIACAAEAAWQPPQRSPAKPGARARIDEDQLLSSVDQEACFATIQHVRTFLQCLNNTIHRRLRPF